jgi:hypothetical protein
VAVTRTTADHDSARAAQCAHCCHQLWRAVGHFRQHPPRPWHRMQVPKCPLRPLLGARAQPVPLQDVHFASYTCSGVCRTRSGVSHWVQEIEVLQLHCRKGPREGLSFEPQQVNLPCIAPPLGHTAPPRVAQSAAAISELHIANIGHEQVEITANQHLPSHQVAVACRGETAIVANLQHCATAHRNVRCQTPAIKANTPSVFYNEDLLNFIQHQATHIGMRCLPGISVG